MLLFKLFNPIAGTKQSVKINKNIIPLLTLFFVLINLFGWIPIIHAEGSRDLVKYGGHRPYLEFIDGETAGIQRQPSIKVFVKAGEQVNVGSSVPLSANNNADIVYRWPPGNPPLLAGGQVGEGSFDVDLNKCGLIDTVVKESAGPLPELGGYTPCTFTAQTTGIYEIEFRAPEFTGKTKYPVVKKVTDQFPINNQQHQTVAAWDVTVFKTPNDPSTEQTGRAYATFLPMDMGNNDLSLNARIFFLNNFGYLYRVNLNGIDPYLLVFFANSKGFQDKADETGKSIYNSVEIAQIDNGKVFLHDPNEHDEQTDITHKIFFNPPAADLPLDIEVPLPDGNTTWLRSTLPASPQINDFKFIGDEGSVGQTGTLPLKGHFSFTVEMRGDYIITIDANNNGVFGDEKDVVMIGPATAGEENIIPWNGLDGLGNPLPAQTLSYSMRSTSIISEMHFPLLDVENNPNGIIIDRVNCDQLPCTVEDSTVFYNNSGLNLQDKKHFDAIPPNPISATAGVDSSNGAQKFSNRFGDLRGIDTWTSLATEPVFLSGSLELKQADISVSKTHDSSVPLTPGGPITYLITVHNAGPSHIEGIQVQDNLPPTITDPFWTCKVTPSAIAPPAIQNRCAASDVEGPLNTTVDLQKDATAIFTVEATISPTVAEGATIDNSVTITRPKDVTNPFGEQLDVKTETATHSVTLAPPTNNPPVAQDKNTATRNDTPVQIPALSAQDSDGSVVSYTVFQLPPTNQGKLYLGDPARGTLITEGQKLTPAQISNLYFKPDLGFGGEVIFNYQAVDDQGSASNTAKVTIEVMTSLPNLQPIADDKFAPPVPNGKPVSLPALSGQDTDGEIISYTITTLPPLEQGTLYLGDPAKGGKPLSAGLQLIPEEVKILFFQPNPEFTGSVSFTYTATDDVGGISEPASVTMQFVASNKIPTSLELELSPPNINLNGNLTVKGKLTSNPPQPGDLKDLTINLIITTPDGQTQTFSSQTAASGEYHFSLLSDLFDQSGDYQLQTHFAGNENLAPIDSAEKTFTVNEITTTLTLELSYRTLSPNESLTAAKGKLTSNSPQGGDLTDLPIKLTITAPDGQIETVSTTTSAGGVYLFTQLPTLTQSGDYRLQAHFAGDERLVASESTEILLAVGKVETAVDDERLVTSESTEILLAVGKVETAVDLELSSVALFLNGKLTAQGNLTSYPSQRDGLKDLPIELTITAPDNQSETFTTNTLANGRYQFLQLPIFDQIGEYRLQAHFAGDERFVASQPTEQLLTVRELAGYALLVQGRDAQGRGQPAYSKSLSRIYRNLRDRGFEDANIIYLGYNNNHPLGIEQIDDTPNKAKIQAALQQLQTRLNKTPAPLYIVALDHGDLEGNFYIDNGDGAKISPQELDRWLTDFENGLNAQALSQQRIIIIGSCYSGHFIPALSQPNSQRVIITSTAAGEESYKGPKEPDGIRSGEYFLEALFDFLSKGHSLTTAFELATQRTEQFTRANDTYSLNEQFQDYAVQHPLLDDNGDQQGSNILGTEGQLAKTIYLGLGEHLADDLFKIESVTPTVYLNADQTSTRLWARLNQSHRVKDQQVVVSIRNPNQQLTTDGTEQREPLEIELDQTNLPAVANSNEFSTVFNNFTQAGRYDLFYSVIDSETGNRLEQHSLVYKKMADNQPPTPVTLRQPENGSNQPTTLIFDWDLSSDPEGEPVTYTFLLATDPAFQPVIYQQEGLRLTMTALTGESLINDPLNQGRPGLRDDTDYVWKVQAIDKYGEMTESPVFAFHTNNTNFPPGLGSLYVYNAVDFTSLENAILDFWLFDENGLPILQDQTPEVFQDQGFYNLVLPMGRRRVTLRAEGYQPQEVVIDTSTDLAEQQVAMIPIAGIPNQPGQLQFAVETTRINENRGEITIVVQRVGGDDGAVTVDYYDSLTGSASRNEDYSVQDGQLSWADQDSSPKKLLVTLYDDKQPEGEETFQLRLREPSGGATLGKFDSMTITIMDDKITDQVEPKEPTKPTEPLKPLKPSEPSGAAGTLQFMQQTYSLNEGIGLVSTFTVTRSGGNQGAVTVQYTTTDNQTAELGLDYTGGTGLLSWADGDDTPKAIELIIIDDSQAESLEKIALQLSEPTGGAQLGIYDQATLIIVDNDEPLPPNPDIALLQFASAINWVQEQEGTIELEVTRTGSSQGEVSVEYIETMNSNATPSKDYLRPHGSLFWADGDMQPQTIQLTLLDDDLPEADKLIDLVLVKPTAPAALGNQSETIVIIQDNDSTNPDESPATIQFTQPFETITEQQREVLIPVVRTGHHSGTASVYYETIANSAIAQQDYLPIQGRLTWNESDNDLVSLVISIIDDNWPEAEKRFSLRLFNPSENVQLGQLTQIEIEIQDDDGYKPPLLMLPNLGRGMILINDDQTLPRISLNCQRFSCLPTTAFRGGSSINGLSYHNPLQLSPFHEVTIQGEIDVEAEHVGQLADLLIVAAWQPLNPNEPAFYWMRDKQGQLFSWDLNLAHLVAAEEQVQLASTQKINFYTGTLTMGKIQLFFGYRLATGEIIFNGEQAIELAVTE